MKLEHETDQAKRFQGTIKPANCNSTDTDAIPIVLPNAPVIFRSNKVDFWDFSDSAILCSFKIVTLPLAVLLKQNKTSLEEMSGKHRAAVDQHKDAESKLCQTKLGTLIFCVRFCF